MARQKQKLNLTISNDARAKAKRLARAQRRSLSTLFEHLVDQEIARNPPGPEPPAGPGLSGLVSLASIASALISWCIAHGKFLVRI